VLAIGTTTPWASVNRFNPENASYGLPPDITLNAFQLGQNRDLTAVGPVLVALGMVMMVIAIVRMCGVEFPRRVLLVLAAIPFASGFYVSQQHNYLNSWIRINQLYFPGQIGIGYTLCLVAAAVGFITSISLVEHFDLAVGDDNVVNVELSEVAPAALGSIEAHVSEQTDPAGATGTSIEVRFKMESADAAARNSVARRRLRSCSPPTALIILALYCAFARHHYVIAFVVAAVLLLQILVLNWRVQVLYGPMESDGAIQRRVANLVAQASRDFKVAAPRIELRRSPHVAAVLGQSKVISLRLSPEMVAQLDDDALKATIYHEFAHLSRNDLSTIRRRLMVTIMLTLFAGYLFAAVVEHQNVFAYALSLVWILPMIRLVNAATGWTNRACEYACDNASASMMRDHDAMARALREIVEIGSEMRRKVLPSRWWQWMTWPGSLRPTSHPSLANRVAHLQASQLATESSR
jgi:Zn-dependent protease with chaperone function